MDKELHADHHISLKYGYLRTGNYAVGAAVIQQADSVYDTAANVGEGIKSVEKASLTGAKFQVYCGYDSDESPNWDPDHLAYWLGAGFVWG